MYFTVGTACQSAGVGVASSFWRVSPFLIPFSALLDWLALRSIYPSDPLPTQEMPHSRPCRSYTRTSPSIRVSWHQWGKRWKIKPEKHFFFAFSFIFFSSWKGRLWRSEQVRAAQGKKIERLPGADSWLYHMFFPASGWISRKTGVVTDMVGDDYIQCWNNLCLYLIQWTSEYCNQAHRARWPQFLKLFPNQ